jgi:hypothetical protein
MPSKSILRFSTPYCTIDTFSSYRLSCGLFILSRSQVPHRDNKDPLTARRLLGQQQSHRSSSARTHKVIVRSMKSRKEVCSLSVLLQT